ncbi:hypothetical protein K6959_04260 [Bacillus aquiflavi]|uniref:hypothetical protein n=1 Tax=Bacillus aquiflavi TaxID=2672567 RepID=UPI001CA83A5E|nr:hypothetical protein [Bacillus aquiflavi]UAC49117.1 hypothetical protein K6959_04260 [Bacillus aquiflavi]
MIRYLLKGNETAIISCMSLDLLNNLLSAPPQKRKRKLEKSAENTASRKLEQAKMLQAEVIFDYTVMPNSNFDHFIIIGNLLIKNIGNTALKNPFICLRINPSDKVELGGQILPPEMTEILAVQGTGGAQGWQYVGEDWLTKAFETGEYWIRPINDVRIMPKETEALRQFQLSIDKLQEKGTITVEGFVYFQEQNLRFPASNRIVFSF